METTPATTGTISSLGATTHSFIAAHPIGVAIVGGIVVALGTYYLMYHFFNKEPQKEEAGA